MSELAAEGDRLGIDLTAPDAVAQIERAQAREVRRGDVVETRQGWRGTVGIQNTWEPYAWPVFPLHGGRTRTVVHLTFVESFELRQARADVAHVRAHVAQYRRAGSLRSRILTARAWIDAAEQRGAGEGDAIRELATELADLTPEVTE